jgi:aminoglycoside 3-N-acetyltransferase I
MVIRIRRLGPGDEALLERIAREADDFDLERASGPDEPLPPTEAATYLRDAAAVHWVAEDGGLVVGELLCHVLRLPSGIGRELLLYAVGVRAAHRRRGVGTALVREMLSWARAEGIEVVWVLADNPGAEAFYTASGFVRGEDGDAGADSIVYYERRVVPEAAGE